MAGGVEVEAEMVAGIFCPNTRSNVEVAKPQMINGEAERVSGFLIACKLYIKMRIRKVAAEEQIQWILSYVQRESQ